MTISGSVEMRAVEADLVFSQLDADDICQDLERWKEFDISLSLVRPSRMHRRPTRVQLAGLYKFIQAGWAKALVELNVPDMKLGLWNEAAKLSDALCHCSRLRSLNLSRNHFRNGGIMRVAVALTQCSALTSLRIAENNCLPECWIDGLEHLVKALAECPALTDLDLSGIALNSFPDFSQLGLGRCTGLITLNLANMRLHTSTMSGLCRALEKCHKLTCLQLGGNMITKKESAALAAVLSTSCTGLTALELPDCLLARPHRLAPVLDHCKGLTSLDLSRCALKGRDNVRHFSAALSKCEHLTHLSLSDSLFWCGRTQVVDLAQGLRQCKTIQFLNLASNGLGSRSEAALPELALALRELRDLQTCVLSSNDMRAAGLRCLVMELAHCKALSHLDVARNPIGEAGVQCIVERISTLTHLDISSCGARRRGGVCDLPEDGGGEGASAGSASEDGGACEAARCLALRQLVCGAWAEGEAARVLPALLRRCSGLQELSLARCALGDAAPAVAQLGGCLRRCGPLTALDLSHSGLAGREVAEVLRALGADAALQRLNLADLGCRAVGLRELEGAVAPLRQLEELSLAGNKADKGGVPALAAMVAECAGLPRLRRLNLCLNGIGKEGARTVREAAARNGLRARLDLTPVGRGDSEKWEAERELFESTDSSCEESDEEMRYPMPDIELLRSRGATMDQIAKAMRRGARMLNDEAFGDSDSEEEEEAGDWDEGPEVDGEGEGGEGDGDAEDFEAESDDSLVATPTTPDAPDWAVEADGDGEGESSESESDEEDFED